MLHVRYKLSTSALNSASLRNELLSVNLIGNQLELLSLLKLVDDLDSNYCSQRKRDVPAVIAYPGDSCEHA